MAKAPQGGADQPTPDQGRKSPPWHTRHLWQIQPVRDLLILLGVFGVFYLGYVLRTVTVPLLLALLLAYLLEPVVRRLESTKYFTRQGAVSGILVAVVAFAVVPIALSTGFAVVQGVDIARTTQVNIDRFNTVSSYVRQHQGEVMPRLDDAGTLGFYPRLAPDERPDRDVPEHEDEQAGDPAEMADLSPTPIDTPQALTASEAFGDLPKVLQPAVYRYLRRSVLDAQELEETDAGGTIAQLLDWTLGIVRSNTARMTEAAVEGGRITIATGLATVVGLGMLLFTLFLTGFFFYFLSTGYAKVRDFGYEVLPHQHRDRIVHLLVQMDKVVAGFVRGRITIAIIQSIMFTIAYWLIGVPAPLIFGPLVGILSIVPYVALLGIPITIAALAIDNSGFLAFQQTWWWTLGAPVVVYFAGQAVDDYLLTPAIQGKATNMDVPTILFASLAGGILAGIYGLLLAIPVAACVKILLRELFWPRFHAWLRGEERDFLPLKR